MAKSGIKAIISSISIINKWEESSCNDLPELVKSIENFKQSVNDFLTDLVNKEKGSLDKCQKDVEDIDEEEEEDVEDTISGFIKKATLDDEMKIRNKRKVHSAAKLREAKRKK